MSLEQKLNIDLDSTISLIQKKEMKIHKKLTDSLENLSCTG